MRIVFTGIRKKGGGATLLIIAGVLIVLVAVLFAPANHEATTVAAMASDTPSVLPSPQQSGNAQGTGEVENVASWRSSPQAKIQLASLPMAFFPLDPLFLSVLSSDFIDDVQEQDEGRENEPSPDVATIVKSYMEEKVETLMDLSGKYEPTPESLEREQEREAVEALVIDAETGMFKNPPVELLPGVHIVSFAPLTKVPSLDSVIKQGHSLLKTGEGEGEAEGEGEPDPFATLDIESDFITFLSSFFEDYTTGMETTFDINAFTVEIIDDVEEILPAPNGIPDLAELLVLETFLKTPALDFSSTGGPSHQDAVNRWQYFETVYGPVSDPSLAPIYRVGLAYSCLDDFMSIYIGAAFLSMATGSTLDFDDLIDAMETTPYHFSQSSDIDGDEYSALIEWQQYGTGQTFDAAYAAYESVALNPSVYPSSITLHTVTRSCDTNVILLYPPEEKVADGVTLTQYATFGYDAALFTYSPYFDHWVVTGESVVSPRYSGADKIEVLVEDDITVQHVIVTPDLSVTVSFPDSALEAAIRTAINKPSGTLLMEDVYSPGFTSLQATNAGIVSLEGLQYCRFLRSLRLSQNSIVTLTPLATLYRLNGLDLGCNQITDLSALANLHDLEQLEIGIMLLNYIFHPSLVNNNRPTSLTPLTSLLHLEYLGLTDTGLQGTALAPFTATGSALNALPALSIGKNPGLDLTPLASLDGLLLLIDHDSNLTNTVLAGLSGSSSLMAVYLFNNNLESLAALSACVDMLEVNVYNNPNFSTVPNTFPDMNVFTADQCALSDITNLGSLSLVSQLSLSDNDINDITPLLNITAFEEGAFINILDNPLAHSQSCAVITALRARDVEVLENAAQCRYTLTYLAGSNGSIAGTTPQTIYIGGDGTSVEAVPDWGYYFLKWSDDRTDNPRTDTNVNEDITVTAWFLPYQYTLTYLAGDHGGIDGPTPQIVDHGEDGLPVTAVPDYGYHFTDWDDGRIDNPRIDTANTEPLTVYASFDINQYNLNYVAGPNGTIFGDSEQLVNHGDCGSAVEALPDTGYHFSQWSDGLSNALRTDCGNTEPLSVTADFYANTYTVTFDSQGGVSPVPQTKTVTYNDNYGTLATTSRTGYIFSSWWTSPTGGKRVLSTTPVTNVNEHAIYAHWTARQYGVYFDCQGGTIPNPPSKVVTFDQPYGPLPVTTREGYTFDGWWTHSVGGIQIFPETIMTNTRYQHTLYAHWTQLSFLLAYLSEEHGSIEGDAEQTVLYGDCGMPVTAVPDTGYHFVLWSDLLPDNPRMDCFNTEPLTVTAGYAINQYTLAYSPGDYGTLSGNNNQLVNHGQDGTTVQVNPYGGRTFVMWSDGVTANPRTDTEVTGDINVTAIISDLTQYTLNYVTGQYGSITGSVIQYVNHSGNGDPVTAVPDAGCYFVKWSDERTDNPRTDTNITDHVSVTAVFAINQYTLNYAANTNGCIWGASLQTVNYGGNGSLIVAGADEGYHFSAWSDGWLNPGGYHHIRRDLNVLENVNAVASFEINHYALNYSGGDNGSIVGESSQWIAHGSNGAVVEAVANEGYHFTEWSDGWRNALGEISATRQDMDVTQSKTVAAVFAINQYTLTYASDAGTELFGPAQQVVNHGEDAAPVIAVGIPGNSFAGWSDGVTDDVRIDQNVTGNKWVVAISQPGQKLWPPPTLSQCSASGDVMYTIDCTGWNYSGAIYKYPDKAYYLPGESVRVCYEPAAGERFIEWAASVEGYDQDDICADARYMDIDRATNCIEFDVSGNTWVLPLVDTDPNLIYMVHPPYPYVTYGDTDPKGTFSGMYGQVIQVTAIPSDGFMFTHWRGFPGGVRYENPLTVELRSNVEEFIPGFAVMPEGSSEPELPPFTGSVVLEGGSGTIFTGDSAPGTISHVENNSCPAWKFATKVEVDKNFFPGYWSWTEQGIEKCYVTSTTETATGVWSLTADTTFTLHLAERIRLNVLVEGEGMVPGYLPYTYNPKPYVNTYNVINALEPAPDINANKVTLSASPHPGWEFSHWEILRDIGWEAVRNSNGLPVEGDLNIWMNWWDDPANPERHVPQEEPVFNVKAVFIRPWVILLSGECEFSGSITDCYGSGINTVLLPSLLANSCYKASFFNEDIVHAPDGDGELYELLVNKLRNLSTKSIVLIGHSHGGGSIYNLCKRFQSDDPRMQHNEYGVRKINIIMTGYVDAIKEEGYTTESIIVIPPDPPFTLVETIFPEDDMRAENRCPQGVQHCSNLYQTISVFLDLNGTAIECLSDPNNNINCLDTVTGVSHTSIDDNIIVTEVIKNRLDCYVYGNNMLNFFYWGNNESAPCE